MKPKIPHYLFITVIIFFSLTEMTTAFQLVKKYRMQINPDRTYIVAMMGPSIGDTRDMFAHHPNLSIEEVRVTVYLANANLSTQYHNSIESACNEWNNQTYNQQTELELSPYYHPIQDDGYNSIGMVTEDQTELWRDFGFLARPDAMGATMIEIDDNNCIQEFDIGLNGTNYTWTNDPDWYFSGPADIWAVVAHELGHGLGFGHTDLDFPNPSELQPVMYNRYNGGYDRTLKTDDKKALGFLYPYRVDVADPTSFFAEIFFAEQHLDEFCYLYVLPTTPLTINNVSTIPNNVTIRSYSDLIFTVPGGLTVVPGARLSFAPGKKLIMNTKLTANNAGFVALNNTNWGGIYLNSGNNMLKDCYIGRADYGAAITNTCFTTIDNCTFDSCYCGLYAYNIPQNRLITITSSTFSTNNIGIYLSNVVARFSRDLHQPLNPLDDKPEWPVPLTGVGIWNNVEYGLWVNNASAYLSGVSIAQNGTNHTPSSGIVVEGNAGQLYGYSGSTVGNNYIADNGTQRDGEIISGGLDILAQNGGYVQIGKRISYICGYEHPEYCPEKIIPENMELIQSIIDDPVPDCGPIYCTEELGTDNYITVLPTGYRIKNMVPNKIAYAQLVMWILSEDCSPSPSNFYGNVDYTEPKCPLESSMTWKHNLETMSISSVSDTSLQYKWVKTLLRLIVKSTKYNAVDDSVLQAFNELSMIYPKYIPKTKLSWGQILNFVETHALSPDLKQAARFQRLKSHVMNRRYKTVYALADALLQNADDGLWSYCQQQKISSLVAQHRFQEGRDFLNSIKGRLDQISPKSSKNMSAMIEIAESAPNPNSLDSVAFNKEAADYYVEDVVVKEYSLSQNYPNPFNPNTIINYTIPVAQYVSLKVYNLLGQEVATLVDEAQEAGLKTVTFTSGNLSSGVYMFRLIAGKFIDVKKMLLIK